MNVVILGGPPEKLSGTPRVHGPQIENCCPRETLAHVNQETYIKNVYSRAVFKSKSPETTHFFIKEGMDKLLVYSYDGLPQSSE